jgi:hypothetical protein
MVDRTGFVPTKVTGKTSICTVHGTKVLLEGMRDRPNASLFLSSTVDGHTANILRRHCPFLSWGGHEMKDDLSDSGSQEDVGLPPLPDLFEEMSRMWGWDASSAKLRNMILTECAVNVFRALREEIGPSRTLEAIKTFNVALGAANASILKDYIKERFGSPYNQAMEVAMPMYWWHCAVSEGHCTPMEIRGGKAVVEVYSCPIALVNPPPEVCIAICHYYSEGVCEYVNPEFEYVWTHHLTNHDGCCRYIVKKKSMKTDLSKLGELEKTIPVLKMSQELRDLLSLMLVAGQMMMCTNASVDAIGSERTVELVAPLARKTGMELGAKLIVETRGINDAPTIRDKLDFLNSALAHRGDPAIVTSSGIEKEIIDCPGKDLVPEMCEHLEELLRGVCEAINPDYEFAYDRMMSKGDHSCHWTVRKKKEVAKEKPKEETPSDDPMKILKMRFAKGEISKSEYEEMRDLLSR